MVNIPSLSKRLSDNDQIKMTEMKTLMDTGKLSPTLTLRECQIYYQSIQKSSFERKLDEAITGGRISAWRCPNLVDKLIASGMTEELSKVLGNVKDLREIDLTKIILYSLNSDDQSLFKQILRQPYQSSVMLKYLKNFGTTQILGIFEKLSKVIFASESLRNPALKFMALILDAHFALLVMQPIFLSILKELHEYIDMQLTEEFNAEDLLGLVKSLKYIRNGSRTIPSNRIRITEDYFVENSIDL